MLGLRDFIKMLNTELEVFRGFPFNQLIRPFALQRIVDEFEELLRGFVLLHFHQ